MTTAEATPPQAGQGAAIDLTAVPVAERKRAFDEAFDYRGDVTLTFTDGSAIECYIFDRRAGASLADSFVRVMPTAGGDKLTIAYERIARLEFTGKDTAAGQRWEHGVRRQVETRPAGAHASIESDPLD